MKNHCKEECKELEIMDITRDPSYILDYTK